MLVQAQTVFAAGPIASVPTGVVGRVLTTDKTGDTSDWIEIATNGEYSLIVRKNYINIHPNAIMYGTVIRDDPKWQANNGFSKAPFQNTNYLESSVRDKVNDWFNGDAPGDADKLPVNARLRAFSMQVFPQVTPGTSSTVAALTNGFSKPTTYQVGVGDDIAFLLSFSEVANFLSKTYFQRGSSLGNTPSGSIASANYDRVNMTSITNYGMWLRSPGDVNNTVGFLADRTGSSAGRAFQTDRLTTTGLIYPAMWVDAEIFTTVAKTPPAPITVTPTGVDGRILTAAQAGDLADWVEIAKIGEFSLIVRKSFINVYPNKVMYGNTVYGDYTWQSTNGYGTTNLYMQSSVRDKINQWFNGTAPGDADKLPDNARLREFTAQSTTKYYLGTCATQASVTNGFSRPTNYHAGIGNDVAFALSYGESANFLSYLHFLRNNYINGVPTANQPSSPIALANYDKLIIPNEYVYGMWLRSLGDTTDTAGYLANELSFLGGRAFQAHKTTSTSNAKGLVYPALWVGSEIFGPVGPTTCTLTYDANGGTGAPAPVENIPIGSNTPISTTIPVNADKPFLGWSLNRNATAPDYRVGDTILMNKDEILYAIWGTGGTQNSHTVTGLVSPMAVHDLWGVEGFLQMFDVVVELRETFLTPAPAKLSTKAVLLKDNSGVGEFTFTDVPIGTYVLYIKRPGYLARPMIVKIDALSDATIVLAPPDPLENKIFVLWPGDVNDDGKIDPEDSNWVASLLGISIFDPINYNPACDFNADGLIDPDDLKLTYQYNNKIVTDYSGADGVIPYL
jgi:hypothetical protein